jgi:O-antigen/teichoic acid export membrane protein
LRPVAAAVDAVPLIQILVLHGLFRVSTANCGPIFLALGQPYILPAVMGLRIAIVAPALYLGILWAGTYGAAWAVTTAAGIGLVVDLTIACDCFACPSTISRDRCGAFRWRPR